MGGGKLSATDDNVGRTVLLVDAHCGQPMDEVDRAAPRLEVCTPQGEKLTELAAIVTHLCSSSHNSEALLGETPEIQAQVMPWPRCLAPPALTSAAALAVPGLHSSALWQSKMLAFCDPVHGREAGA